MYLYTPNDVTIRVGEKLQLNCSVAGVVNSSKVQFSWYHGTRRLTKLTRPLNDRTVQLLINNVSWSDNGTYVCRENTRNRVQPVSVTVRVGGKFRFNKVQCLLSVIIQSCMLLAALSTLLINS